MNIVINDSSKLVNIFGKNDENLRLIEKEVSVEIIPHGNTIQISGDKSNLNIAESIILDMVERDNLGVNNNIDEVSGSIRVKNGQGQGHLAFNVVTWFLWMTIVGLILGYFVD